MSYIWSFDRATLPSSLRYPSSKIVGCWGVFFLVVGGGGGCFLLQEIWVFKFLLGNFLGVKFLNLVNQA